ncbi:MAG: FtsQ-type POTRA domain-containing protein [Anaerolineales bacterium]|nr:FtsQ-type POTRA domain-containing protein [Anaerolineales bacterium]MCX7754976.1 FtsQ-type POTRA domain-containing protein [Anaerolineales bacterium]MDW8277354.1 FtsQ-type POTRA domain-containing protein [Anaerolineales bacterium]
MSPDRLTLTRAEAIRRRKEEEQKRREKLTQKRVQVAEPPSAPPADRPTQVAPRVSPTVARSRFRARYDVAAMPLREQVRPQTSTRWQGAAFSLPKITFGPRWFSLLLVIACVLMLYFYVTEPVFLAQEAVILGNGRVSAQEINTVLGIRNRPAAFLNPAQIEYNIRASFPEIYGAYVQVELPARVTITVVERQPVAAWQQDGQVLWVDAQGYAFPPRGEAAGLITVNATGSPPAPEADPSQTVGARPFLRPELSAAIATLAPQIPEGATLVYDPKYGLGWSDPRGWQAYFGNNNQNMHVKLLVYQALVENLTARGVQPTVINVEYPDAPFYRISKND